MAKWTKVSEEKRIGRSQYADVVAALKQGDTIEMTFETADECVKARHSIRQALRYQKYLLRQRRQKDHLTYVFWADKKV